jgi:hypothetical protein
MKNYEYDNNNGLNPNFVTGLTDAEGCFSVVRKNNKAKFKFNVGLRFQIKMLKNEIELLNMVKYFFNCGVLYYGKDNTVAFTVQDFSSFKNIIIPHFLKYPLRGTKYLDFMSLKKAFDIIDKKEHLSKEGIDKCSFLSNNMNSYRKDSTFIYSPIHTKEDSNYYIPLNGHYISGFIAGDGCLSINLKGNRFGLMYLSIGQHINNRLLLETIVKYFKNSSKLYSNGTNMLQLNLYGTKSWDEIIFVHFSNYPLYGTKIIKLNKLIIRKLIKSNNTFIKIGKHKEWKPEYVLQIKNIWKIYYTPKDISI